MFLQKLMVKTRRFFRRTEGASAIEYALIVAMVALLLVAFVPTLGDAVTKSFQAIEDALTTSLPATPPPAGG
ncbi:Flp family type IVb pilin [Pseudomonas kielensis]|uniref:Flp family type IVb pilin n=1 Tax=Pseudomonas kielensis TaxID=2762577 RepID=A0A7X1G9E9_9PSED|nr:Flp family type IVb pilin [Pseudomonas kielensis]MBC2688251.1 Flp family type IVb pilin [Pseudomonas kielensis]